MAYITITDLEHRLGNRAMVQLTNHDETHATTIDETVAQQAIDDAQGIVDGYLGNRVEVPLPTPSAFVITLTKWIAEYILKSAKGQTSGEGNSVTKLYNDAILHLKRFEAGDASLGLALPDTTGGTETDATNDNAEITSQPRQNTRTSLGNLT